MKRTLRLASLFCILVTIPLALTWATWEGNAGTGAPSDFPGSGLYARSDMFPRNTVVQIVNLESGSSVRAVITGSSGVPGLVAVLAPETAAALNIREGAVVRIRITTPAPVGERPAPGTLDTGDGLTVADPDVNPEAMVPLAAITGTEDAPMIPVPEVVEPQTFDEAREALDLNTAPDATVGMPEEDLPADETVPGNNELSTEAPGEELAEDGAETVFAGVAVPEATPDVPGATMDEAAVAAAGDASAFTPTEEAPVPETADSGLYYDEPELIRPETAEGSTVDEITLEPAELRPPVVDSEAFPIVPPVVPEPVPETASEESVSPVEPDTKMPDEVKPVFGAMALLPVAPAEAVSPSKNIPEADSGDYPWIDRFESGAYYVQIAAYKDTANVRTILTRFGKKYPVKVQKGETTEKPLVKVFVGPLKKDEYGAVLEYFRKNGFADAFVRKIP